MAREYRGTGEEDVPALGGVEELFIDPAVLGGDLGLTEARLLHPLVQLCQSLAQVPPPLLRLPRLPAHEPVGVGGGLGPQRFGGDGGEVGGRGFGMLALLEAGEYPAGIGEDAFDLEGEGLVGLDEAWDLDEVG